MSDLTLSLSGCFSSSPGPWENYFPRTEGLQVLLSLLCQMGKCLLPPVVTRLSEVLTALHSGSLKFSVLQALTKSGRISPGGDKGKCCCSHLEHKGPLRHHLSNTALIESRPQGWVRSPPPLVFLALALCFSWRQVPAPVNCFRCSLRPLRSLAILFPFRVLDPASGTSRSQQSLVVGLGVLSDKCLASF